MSNQSSAPSYLSRGRGRRKGRGRGNLVTDTSGTPVNQWMQGNKAKISWAKPGVKNEGKKESSIQQAHEGK